MKFQKADMFLDEVGTKVDLDHMLSELEAGWYVGLVSFSLEDDHIRRVAAVETTCSSWHDDDDEVLQESVESIRVQHDEKLFVSDFQTVTFDDLTADDVLPERFTVDELDIEDILFRLQDEPTCYVADMVHLFPGYSMEDPQSPYAQEANRVWFDAAVDAAGHRGIELYLESGDIMAKKL